MEAEPEQDKQASGAGEACRGPLDLTPETAETSHVPSLDLSSSICARGTLSQLILEAPRGPEVWGSVTHELSRMFLACQVLRGIRWEEVWACPQRPTQPGHKTQSENYNSRIKGGKVQNSSDSNADSYT